MATKNIEFKSNRPLPIFASKYAFVQGVATVDQIDIRRMIEEDYDVYEVLDNGAELKLNYTNYKTDNSAEKIKAPTLTVANTTIYTSDSYDIMTGVTATSKAGANIIDLVVIESNDLNHRSPGVYTTVYKVTDPDNKMIITKSRTTTVKLTREITVKYTGPTRLCKGDKFTLKEFIVAEDQTGDKTGITISTVGTVNTNTVGDYTVVYNATAGKFTGSLTIRFAVTNPLVTLTTPDDGYYLINEPFDPYIGVRAINNETNKSVPYSLDKTEIDITKEGSHVLTYSVDYNGFKLSKIRIITITKAPVWVGSATTRKQTKTPFTLADAKTGLSVTGFNNSSILNSVVAVSNKVNTEVIGTYDFDLKVTDPVTKFSSTFTRKVKIIVNNPPVINGVNNTSITRSDTVPFDPRAGVSVSDNDDNLTVANIVITGAVDAKTVGVYTLVYKLSDGFTEVTKTRNVIVTA